MREFSARAILLLPAAVLCFWLSVLAALAQTAPSITQQPANQSVVVGSSATLSVGVSGTGPFRYQWQFNGVNLEGIGIITTVAGNGAAGYGGDGGPATSASLNNPAGVAVDSLGNFYIADQGNGCVRKVGINGVISTLAATMGPTSVAVDAAGNLFIGDPSADVIYKLDTHGVVTIVAGNGTIFVNPVTGKLGFGDGGPATNANLSYPAGVAVDTAGNLFIADNLSRDVRKVATDGIITRFAGNTEYGYGGDGGPASNAWIACPVAVAFDPSGILYIADNGYDGYRYDGYSSVRAVASDGIISTFAGNLADPDGVCADNLGNVYIVDSGYAHVLQVYGNGMIQTCAGNGYPTFSGDNGPATSAGVDPKGVAVDSLGNLLIADQSNNRIRKVAAQGPSYTLFNATGANTGSYDLVVSSAYGSVTSQIAMVTVFVPPNITVQPQRTIVASGQTATFSVTAQGFGPISYQWLFNKTPLLGDTSATLTLPSVTAANVGSYNVIVANPYGSITSAVAFLSLGQPPIIRLQPQSATYTNGDSVAFGVMAVGSLPLSYQWFFDGTAVPGGTNSALILYPEAATNIGSYSVVITGPFGSTASSVVTLAAGPAPVITAQPASLAVLSSQSAVFTVTAGGSSPLFYQWLLDGVNLTNNTRITGVQSSSLSITAVQSSDQGSYSVIVTNAIGVITSSIAVLSLAQLPSISVQPQSYTFANGDSVAFAVAASGTPPLGYQWLFNGTPLQGDTAASLTLASESANNIGSYSVVVTNAFGSVTSSVATLSAGPSPAITVQPASLAATNGQSLIFSVTALGVAPLFYQWLFDGANLPNSPRVTGAQSSVLSITNLQSSDQGSYAVLITNAFGSITSSIATLSVGQPPSISVEPQSSTETNGQSVVFTVVVGGAPPLAYQWLFDGMPVSGATGSALSLQSESVGNIGSYSVVITNAFAGVTSSVATLSAGPWPVITAQPVGIVVTNGQSAVFAVTASGSSPLFYQWLFDGMDLGNSTRISGVQTANLTINNVQSSDQGTYVVVVSNSFGLVESTLAALTVNTTASTNAPAIVNQPASQSLPQGTEASFSVGVSGAAPLFYQWLFDGTNLANNTRISGAQDNVLTITNIQSSDQGSYQLIVSNAFGVAESPAATLTVGPAGLPNPPVILEQPASLNIVVRSSGTLSVYAAGQLGPVPLSYQWLFDGTSLVGATAASLIITNAQTANAGSYQAIVSDSFGALTSVVATVTVGLPPQITTQPNNQWAVIGGNAAFTVNANGSAPLNYQWQMNGQNLPNSLIVTVAGNGIRGYGGDGAAAVNANLSGPADVVVDASGNLFIADTYNYRIRQVGTDGIITTVAGNGNYLYSGDGFAATNAALNAPQGLVVDGSGNLYIADTGNNRIRKVDSNGIITTVAGNGAIAFSGDGGAGTAANLQEPWAVALDASGNLYIADRSNFRVRELTVDGIIFTVAGSSYGGDFGDGGPAIDAGLVSPCGLAFDALGDLFIADQDGFRIREVNPAGIISTVAGGGGYHPTGDGGPAIAAGIYPFGISVDYSGNLFIADSFNSNIRMVDTDGIIHTVAGNGSKSFAGDGGAATNAGLDLPHATAPDASGNLFIADQGNNRIRLVFSQQPTTQAPTLMLNNVTASNAGSYDVVIANIFGSVTSAVAILAIGSAPLITVEPTDQSVVPGSNAAFTVTSTGTPPLTCQWLFNGAPLQGDTEITLTLPAVTSSDSGDYSVIISSPYGSVTSGVAQLSLLEAPVITSPPQSTAVASGQSALFSVTATGTPPLAYQWLFNGTALPGDTEATLLLPSVSANITGTYQVIVASALGSVTSSGAALLLYQPPSVTVEPQSLSQTNGQPAVFSVTAAGAPPLSYQWLFNGVPLAGQTNAVLTLPSVTAADTGSYSVVVSNPFGGLTSDTATLAPQLPPSIAVQPQSLIVPDGQSALFTVTANGTPPLAYQWLFNGTPLPGDTGSALMFASVAANNAGSYSIIVTNAYGSVTSTIATLSQPQPPSITIQPQSLEATNGQPAIFTVTATGTAPLAYQWLFNGTPLPGDTNVVLILPSVTASNAGSYRVVITNAYGTLASSVAILSALEPPSILIQPQSLDATNSQAAVFSVAAGGTDPLSYQWLFNGTPLSAATSAVLTLLSVAQSDAGDYSVIVTNAYGSATSGVAALTVKMPAAIIQQPKSQAVIAGSTVSLSVAATGTSPLNYQWVFNGSPISGTTVPVLTLQSFSASNAGTYSVTVSNVVSTVASDNASMTLKVPDEPDNWTGATNSNWDFTSLNWSYSGQPILFQNGDAAVFADSASAGATNITIPAGIVVYPAFITDSANANNYTIGGQGSIGGAANLLKTGSSTLTINTSNNFSGGVAVLQGTLQAGAPAALGTGPASVLLSGTLELNGALTLNNGASLLGTTVMKVDPTGNDSIVSPGGPIVFGGSLVVNSLATNGFSAGQTFQLFSAPSYSGAFSSIVLPALGSGLAWDTTNLTADGTLAVYFNGPPPLPATITTASFVGTNFTITGSGGAPGGTYRLLTSTNLALPWANWTLATTGIFDNNGNFTATAPYGPADQDRFYIIASP